MRASGTAQLFGATAPKGGKLDVEATGSVSMALLHTFDNDILSTGKVEFTVAAGGQVSNPDVTGKVQFDKVNIAIDGVPNGLSNMNGTLVLDDGRLKVESLTATTGGGALVYTRGARSAASAPVVSTEAIPAIPTRRRFISSLPENTCCKYTILCCEYTILQSRILSRRSHSGQKISGLDQPRAAAGRNLIDYPSH